jgi:hypothetical protein
MEVTETEVRQCTLSVGGASSRLAHLVAFPPPYGVGSEHAPPNSYGPDGAPEHMKHASPGSRLGLCGWHSDPGLQRHSTEGRMQNVSCYIKLLSMSITSGSESILEMLGLRKLISFISFGFLVEPLENLYTWPLLYFCWTAFAKHHLTLSHFELLAAREKTKTPIF